MGTYKQDRAAEDIKRELAAVIRELKDPRIAEHLISVSRAEVTADLSYVKVYVSAIEGSEKTKESVKALKGASGYLRRELGSRMKLRKVPELKFIADDSIEISANISKIVNSFEKNEENENE